MKKKLLVLLFLLISVISLAGCGETETQSKAVEINNGPQAVTGRFIEAVTNFEYTATQTLFTEEFNSQYLMMNDFINVVKPYNDIFSGKELKEPIIKETADKANLWYEYTAGEFVYFHLVKLADEWKISQVSLWSEKKQGNPNDAKLE